MPVGNPYHKIKVLTPDNYNGFNANFRTQYY